MIYPLAAERTDVLARLEVIRTLSFLLTFAAIAIVGFIAPRDAEPKHAANLMVGGLIANHVGQRVADAGQSGGFEYIVALGLGSIFATVIWISRRRAMTPTSRT
jgi:hypothetical protein